MKISSRIFINKKKHERLDQPHLIIKAIFSQNKTPTIHTDLRNHMIQTTQYAVIKRLRGKLNGDARLIPTFIAFAVFSVPNPLLFAILI